MWWCCVFFFFFFQAEDGIRDWSVTGVQTCALPIWVFFGGRVVPWPFENAHQHHERRVVRTPVAPVPLYLDRANPALSSALF